MRDIHGLDPSQRARLRPILENALEDSAHHVERADPVGPSIDDIEPKQLVGGDVDRMGRVLTRPAIEDDVVGRQTQEPFPIEPPGSVRRRDRSGPGRNRCLLSGGVEGERRRGVGGAPLDGDGPVPGGSAAGTGPRGWLCRRAEESQ